MTTLPGLPSNPQSPNDQIGAVISRAFGPLGRLIVREREVLQWGDVVALGTQSDMASAADPVRGSKPLLFVSRVGGSKDTYRLIFNIDDAKGGGFQVDLDLVDDRLIGQVDVPPESVAGFMEIVTFLVAGAARPFLIKKEDLQTYFDV